MPELSPFVDVHCHLLPEVDDGASSWEESLAMARIAVEDGIGAIIATPHQMGNYNHNDGPFIRQRVEELQALLHREHIPLEIRPGADVRIETEMFDRLQQGRVLTLADQGKHVLLELPHEIYLPLEPVMAQLESLGMVGVLSHPERNRGLMQRTELIAQLVDQGCLMQITAGSLLGTFGSRSQEVCHWMLQQGLVHLIATDAHGQKSRRPLISRAYRRVVELVDRETADLLCRENPRRIYLGQSVPLEVPVPARGSRRSWRFWKKADSHAA